MMSVTLTRRCKLMKSIKNRREHIGLTQAQFASSLQVSRATVAMWETEKSYPRADLLPKIAQLLGCTIDDLYADEPSQAAV